MENNLQQSPIIVFMKKVWPFIYRVINGIIYFIIMLIRNFFKDAIRMIKGV
ncbi:MAG TPA: hypothetical protein VNW29_07280 [Candidatus Sulfotelmatobacter sp.]|nr:hypothetical protein [Candidatus Sulfotelmatobacter sp.]